MGTWDTGSFDNDTAVDWTYGLERVDDLGYVEEALDRLLGYDAVHAVPADIAECAVAAAEVVARLMGNWGEESAYSETADQWVRNHPFTPPGPLTAKAVAALDRIVTAPSEILELWGEADETGAWVDAVRDLKRRLTT